VLKRRPLRIWSAFSELVQVPHGFDLVRRNQLGDLVGAVAGSIGRPPGDGEMLIGS